ncbi:MAG TPA: MFS transporter, partial [Devosia sp.]|nr:MFS transporter [Devosia sp.]
MVRLDREAPGRTLPLIIASVMMLVTLAIDVVLPALPAIGRSLAIESDNDRQWIIGAFMLGFALSQAGIGPLSDAWGRRRLLLFSLCAYALLGLAAAAAQDLETMLSLRAAQGAAGGMTRVLITAMVRDLYAGSRMARVMSLATTAFIIAPILGPTLGALILTVGSWRWIFVGLAGFGGIALFIVYRQLPETLAPLDRRPLSPGSFLATIRHVCREPQSACFTVALTFRFASQFTFLLTVQQIFEHVWHREELLAPVLGGIAIVIALGAFANAQFVTRFGLMRIASYATTSLLLLCLVQLAIVLDGGFTLLLFTLFQAVISALTSICNATFQALAMEHMGGSAGTASSLQASTSMLGGTVLAGWAGQAFDGTLVPYATALALFASGA